MIAGLIAGYVNPLTQEGALCFGADGKYQLTENGKVTDTTEDLNEAVEWVEVRAKRLGPIHRVRQVAIHNTGQVVVTDYSPYLFKFEDSV